MELQQNMGIADRIVRSAVALGLIAATGDRHIKDPLKTALLFLSGVLLITAVKGKCPLYQLMDLDSRRQFRKTENQLPA